MFITISKGLDGTYFIILADDSGPIERIDCCNYSLFDDAEFYAIQLAKEFKVVYK